MNSFTKKKFDLKMMVKLGLVAAISVIMTVTPLGTIRFPWTEATIACLATIIFAVLEGPFYGGICGLFLGIISMVYCLMNPAVLNVYIAHPLVCIPARILIGVSAGYCYKWLKAVFVKSASGANKNVREIVSMGIAAAAGSFTNTVGVLGMLYLIHAKPIAENLMELDTAAAGWLKAVFGALLGIATTNGLMEIIILAVLTPIITKALLRAGYK